MKKLIAIILTTIYAVLLFSTYLPYFIYFGQQISKVKNQQIISYDESKTLIGDACYLNALIKRTSDNDSNKKQTTPPPVDLSENIYIYSTNIVANINISCTVVDFKKYMISIKETFLEIDSPPPKLLVKYLSFGN
jgi:hypothetical protein